MSGYNRLAPFPYDAIVGGVGVMLKPDPQTGAIISSPKVQPFDQVAPDDYSYSSIPPFDEQSYEFRRILMGMGERRQQFRVVRRYWYADGVDASINGMPMLGPFVNTIVPPSTGELRGFVEAQVAGVLKLFALAGQYVLVSNGDNPGDWSISKDVGAGRTVQSAVRFKDAGATPKDALYVTTDAGKMWRFDGTSDTTNWVDITANLSATAGDQSAAFLETDGRTLYRAWGANRIANCTADPNVAANWSGNVFVGDASHNITWLRLLKDSLFIFKDNGAFTIDATGQDHELFPGLRSTPNALNGRNAAVWLDLLYFHYGDAFYSMGPNTSGIIEMHPVGPERFIENDSPVSGPIVCSAGWNNWFNFLGMFNTQNNASYLLKFGSWFVDDQPPLGSSAYVRTTAIFNPMSAGGSFMEPVIHGAIASFPDQKITAMQVSSLSGINQRLYLGFSDGTVGWIVLPRGSPNPLADPACRFQSAGSLYFGDHVMGFPANYKSFRGATVFGPTIDGSNTAEIDYRLATDNAYTALGQFTQSGQRIDLPDGTSGTSIQLALTLAGTGDSSPFVEGFAFHETLRPDLLLERNFTVMAHDRIARRDGSNDWRSAEQIRAALQQAANAKGVTPTIMPDGRVVTLEYNDYAELLAADQRRFGLAWDITLKGIEFKSLVQFGTIGRLAGRSIGSLAGTLIQDLETL